MSRSNTKLNYALLHAAYNQHHDKARQLIENGADADFAMPDNSMMSYGFRKDDTPLIGACMAADSEMVGILAAAGADVEKCNASSRTPLMIAVTSGSLDCMEMLVNHGCDVNRISSDDETALGVATIFTDSVDKVSWLISRGADVNLVGMHDSTVLGTFSKTNAEMLFTEAKLSMLECLLKSGSNPNVMAIGAHALSHIVSKVIPQRPFSDKMTQVMTAMAVKLLQYGADPYLASTNGRSALDEVTEIHGAELASLMKNARDQYLLNENIRRKDDLEVGLSF